MRALLAVLLGLAVPGGVVAVGRRSHRPGLLGRTSLVLAAVAVVSLALAEVLWPH